MKCPKCEATKNLRVQQTKKKKNYIERIKKCEACSQEFVTVEIVVQDEYVKP